MLLKRNLFQQLKGKGKFIPSVYEDYSVNKVNDVKEKVNFIKSIFDYIFPEIILYKIHIQNKSIHDKYITKNYSFKLPYEKKDEMFKIININKKLELNKSINIINYKRAQSK